MAALLLIAFGNLALPVEFQAVLGVDYLALSVGVALAIAASRFPVVLTSPLPWISAILFLGLSVPGFVVAPISAYGRDKAIVLALAVLLPFMAVSFAAIRPTLSTAFGLTAVLAAGLAAVVLMYGVTAANGRVSIFALNPVGVSRFIGVGIVFGALCAFGLVNVGGWLLRIAGLVVTLLSFAAVLKTGSRGPLVSAVIALAICVVVVARARRVSGKWTGFAVLVGATGAIVASISGEMSLDFLDAGRGDSGRALLYAAAVDSVSDQPLGLGWGNYPLLFGYSPEQVLYPHNLFLEIGVEGGVIALLIGVVIVTWVLVLGLRTFAITRSSASLCAVALFAYALLNAQFSSDIVGNRMLWVSLAIVIALAQRREVRAFNDGVSLSRGGRVVL